MSEFPEITMLVPASRASGFLGQTIQRIQAHFNRVFPGKYEIVIVTNGAPSPETTATREVADSLANGLVRVIHYEGTPGKGVALKQGVMAARGRYIFFTDADLPYDLDFFDKAYALLQHGISLVTGNRRMIESRFNVPVLNLHLAYRRHRLGIWFNRFVRALFPIKSTDTQAGMKAFTTELGRLAFGSQICTGFLFDLEIFLTADAYRMTCSELPVTLSLDTEKTTVRLFREFFYSMYWLFRIRRKQRGGGYGPAPQAKGYGRLANSFT